MLIMFKTSIYQHELTVYPACCQARKQGGENEKQEE